VSDVMRIRSASLVTATPATAASTTASTSAGVTESMLATFPVPATTPSAKPSAAFAVPPVTSTLEEVPRRSLVMVTRVPPVVAVAFAPAILALMTAATSSAVAAPMAANSLARNGIVCTEPPSIRTVSACPSARAKGSALPLSRAAAAALNVAVAGPPPSTATTRVSPGSRSNGPGTEPSTLPAVAASAAVGSVASAAADVLDAGVLMSV